LATYQVYFIEGSQLLFVEVRCTTSSWVSVCATPVNKSWTLQELFKWFGKKGSKSKYFFF